MSKYLPFLLIAVAAFALYEFFKGQGASATTAQTIAPAYVPATALAGYAFAQSSTVALSAMPTGPASPVMTVPEYVLNPRVAEPQSNPPVPAPVVYRES